MPGAWRTARPARAARSPGSVARGTAYLRARGCLPGGAPRPEGYRTAGRGRSRPGVGTSPCRPRPWLWRFFAFGLLASLVIRDLARPIRPQAGRLRSPNTNAAASSTSTPSSGSTAPPGQPTPRPPGPPSLCSLPPLTRPPAPSGSPRPPRRGSRPARWPGGASSIYGQSQPAAT
jgi:hypothetical protein